MITKILAPLAFIVVAWFVCRILDNMFTIKRFVLFLALVLSASVASAEWKKGPLPPKTYNWGGVTIKGEDLGFGFHFADFFGDHVKILRIEKSVRGGEKIVWERVEPDQVLYYNNSLDLPPREKK